MTRRAVAMVIAGTVLASSVFQASAFEGRITAVKTQDGQVTSFLYTRGSNSLRIEVTETSGFAGAIDLFDNSTGALTILFPHNKSFVRVPTTSTTSSLAQNPVPTMPPPTIPAAPSPNAIPALASIKGSGVSAKLPTLPSMPAASLPALPVLHVEKAMMVTNGLTTNLLGFKCTGYLVKQEGKTIEVWATADLFPFRAYLANQPRRFGPRLLEDFWSEPLTEKKLFPLLAVWRENGTEKMRFEIKSIQPETLLPMEKDSLIIPVGYQELRPLPF